MAKNYFGITDTGKVRQNNEDTLIAETIWNNRFIAACVIDGVGGYDGGEVAATLAHDAILNSLNSGEDDVITKMREAFASANKTIYKEKVETKEREQMACVLTLALADVNNNKFYYAHVGDTRLYLLRDHSLIKVTKDHSFVGFLEDSGRLTEEAAMRHPKRNEINKALGFDPQMSNIAEYIETGESPFLPGDTLLLCSDGLSDMIDNNTMTSILNTDDSLQEKGNALIKAANEAGGKDNITAVLVKNDKEPSKHEATKPTPVLKKNDEARQSIAPSKNDVVDKVATTTTKKSSGAVGILSVLCVLLLAAFLWAMFKDSFKKPHEDVAPITKDRKKSDGEQKLVDNISSTTNHEVFVINPTGGEPIVITDSILINKDSLHLIGNGITLIADSTYSGAGLVLSPATNYVLLDSMIIENFDVGVIVKNRGLHFRNVLFKNCRIPVQYQYMFPDNKIINGRFTDTVFYPTDSL